MNFFSLSNIKREKVKRYKTSIDSLNEIYGRSGDSCGIPHGKISMLAGEAGAGKSRLSIFVAKDFVDSGRRVLYFQSETVLSDFAQWVQNANNEENFFVSEEKSVKNQLEIIRHIKPNLVVVDSISKLKDFGSGSSKAIEEIIEGNELHDGYESVVRGTSTHVLFLCQLNKDGKSKGSSTLPHLVDQVFFLTREDDKVKLACDKNRCGKVLEKNSCYWVHKENGLVPYGDNKKYFPEINIKDEYTNNVKRVTRAKRAKTNRLVKLDLSTEEGRQQYENYLINKGIKRI